MYEIGEFIIYSNEGVCKVESIGELNISGVNKKNKYYTLTPISENGKIFVPIDTNLFMREMITEKEIEKLIQLIPSIEELECNEKNIRLLQAYYNKFLQTHECIDLLTVISSIYDKKANAMKKGKKLGQIDQKVMKIAQGLIDDEFSVVLDIPREEVQSYIKNQINKNKN